MQSLEAIPKAWAAALRGVAFDLDDTLLDRGRLLPEALSALYGLEAAGLELYAVTGRPAGWGAVVTRHWPLTGAVTENGAIAFWKQGRRVELMSRATMDSAASAISRSTSASTGACRTPSSSWPGARRRSSAPRPSRPAFICT
jgi:hypothetical protein